MPKAKNKAEVSNDIDEVATPVAPQISEEPTVKDKPQSESKSISDLMKKLVIVNS